jgi:GNAT superfamily N-acetyltransferase
VIKIVHVDDPVDDVRSIERVAFAGIEDEIGATDLDHFDPETWIAYDDDHPVAFGVLVHRPDSGWCPGWYLRAAGTLPEYRGQGLQRRLVRARLAYARRSGAPHVLTFTLPQNAASMRSLISCGFKPHRPTELYAGPGWVYWRKDWT